MLDILSFEALSKLSTDELKRLKKIYDDAAIIQKNIEQAIKILINSLYGYIGSEYSRFFNLFMAEGITLSGQVTIKTSELTINKMLQKMLKDTIDRVIAIDTDSNYIDLTDLVNHPKLKWNELTDNEIVDKLDHFCKTLLDRHLTEAFQQLNEDLNGFRNTIDMKREAIGSGVFVAPKNYTMLVYDNEGKRYHTPELKVTGLEAVRSDTPSVFRDELKKVYKMMYYNTESEITDTIAAFREKYMSMDLKAIGEPTGVSLDKYTNSNKLGVFEKGCPYHVKAAFTYNTVLQSMNLTNDYSLIGEGDKVKLYRLKKENPFNNKRIAIPDKIPKEFELDDYVDRVTMFEEGFIKACNRVLNVRNWNAVKTNSLDDLFGW